MIGKKILHYKILEKLGEGGMGIVYKALDTKLNRDVAIKLLPPHLLVSEDDRARFNREAKAAAALNHNHIATVYEINETDGKPFIVMEYVDGKTLDHTIAQAPLKLEDAISITIQIADGLGAAHKKDVVHRDIKASNILLGEDNKAKILDFGLAKTSMSTKLTQMGTTIGTVAYMSPEQIQGKEVDNRTDLWSLGVLLYEMIAGHLPFKAEYDQAVFYSIQNENPDPLTSLRTGVPMSLEWIVNKLIAKNPSERYQSAFDLIIDLKAVDINDSGFSRISKTVSQNITPMPSSKKQKLEKRSFRIFAHIGLVLALLIATAIVTWHLKPVEEKILRKFVWQEDYNEIEISPDGKKLAYTQNEKLWIQHWNSFEPVSIPNTGNILSPLLWSPNSRELAFYTVFNNQFQLKKIAAKGGQSQPVANFPQNFEPCFWGYDDSLVFRENNNSFYKMATIGGELVEMYHGDTTLCKTPNNLQSAYRMPGNNTMVLTINSAISNEILIQNENERKSIFSIQPEYELGEAVYSNSGHIIFHRRNVLIEESAIPYDLWAIPFDLAAFKAVGKPFFIATNGGYPDVTEQGTLFYGKQNQSSISERLVRLSRKGVVLDSIGTKHNGSISWPNLSNNGMQILLNGKDGNKQGLWLHDPKSKTLLLEGDNLDVPVFSKDGKEIFFRKNWGEKNSPTIFRQSLSGLGEARRVNTNTNEDQYAPYLSPSNSYLLYVALTNSGELDIYYQHISENIAKPLIKTINNEVFARLSPDEHYMVFQSNKSGRYEIYLTRFPDVNVQRQISKNGGRNPLWIGEEIFYVSPSNELMIVKVKVKGSDISINQPQLLFAGNPINIQLTNGFYDSKYTVSKNGQEITAVYAPQASTDFMVLVENWYEEFRDKE